MTDGFGSITWWGFSPALDFQEKDVNVALEEMTLKDEESDVFNVLMVGAGDCRHLLKTLARTYRHPERTIHVYVLENNLELYARDLLLLTIALEQQHRMGLQEKCELFLELFGNSLVRQQSMEYVEKMATQFIKMVTDFDYLEKTLPIIDLSNLKFKERDALEAIFKFWRNPDKNLFDIRKYWDLRLRQYLGTRYDSIPNVFDWDYSIKLVDKGASIINKRLYNEWRHHGPAFTIREGSYDTPNKTLASGMLFKKEGELLARRGYWGDIIVSPYICFGIECEEDSFFQKANKVHTKTAEDVSEFNILSLFHEIAHREKYTLPETPEVADPPEKEPAQLTEITEEDEEEEEEKDKPTDIKDNKKEIETQSNPLDAKYEPIEIQNFKLFFLPLNCGAELHKKSKYQKKFNFVYIANSLVHLLTEDLSQTFADKATVILETSKFMLELKKEQHQEFLKKITSMATGLGCQATKEFDEMDTFAQFIFTRKS